MNGLSVSTATTVIEAAHEKAAEIDVPMCIAVVDRGTNLVAFRRMDGAILASITIAQDKGYSAVAMEMPTHELADVAQPNEPIFGINTTNDSRLIIFGGGLLLNDGEKIVGAVGVSGGSPEEDVTVAEAGVEAFESE
jgi:uncharacterized protein GlcG (DUF336 family)